jgi:hypothetical protein
MAARSRGSWFVVCVLIPLSVQCVRDGLEPFLDRFFKLVHVCFVCRQPAVAMQAVSKQDTPLDLGRSVARMHACGGQNVSWLHYIRTRACCACVCAHCVCGHKNKHVT